MTKERLRQYQQLKREKDMLEEKLVELESAMTSPRIQKLDGMPQGQHQGGSLLDLLVEQHITLKNVYANKLRELNDTLLDIETAIESLTDPTERNLMRLRYIDGLTWEMVCVEIGYEWSQTHRKHASALERLRDCEE
jgi:DNA-directed RNA polymerase specialized sigma24 family protein